MESIDADLTIEQLFELRALRDHAQHLTHDELVALIVNLTRLNMHQRAMFAKLIKQHGP